jgi:hypothetical protein
VVQGVEVSSTGGVVVVHGIVVSSIGVVLELWAGKVHLGKSVHVVVDLPHQFQFACAEGSVASRRRARWIGVVEGRILSRS